MIDVVTSDLNNIFDLHHAIPEFDPVAEDFFSTRLNTKKYVVHVARVDGEKAGYMITYDRFSDGSAYGWMGGVVPKFRRRGVYQKMMAARMDWARENGFDRLVLKTRQHHKSMLAYLTHNDWMLFKTDPRDPPDQTRLWFEKKL